jgi:hypothetical protein
MTGTSACARRLPRVRNSDKSEKERLHSIAPIRVMNITDGEAARGSNSLQEINKTKKSHTAPGSLTGEGIWPSRHFEGREAGEL